MTTLQKLLGATERFCSIDVENQFGPIVDTSCLDGFDFTLLFEETVLTILPLGLTLLFVAVRLDTLAKRKPRVRKSWLLWSKMLCYIAYIALTIAALAAWSDSKTPKTSMTIPSTVFTIVSYTVLMYTSYLEHTRSIRPSTVLGLFYLTWLLDFARARTLLNVAGQSLTAKLNLAAYAVKGVLFVLEVIEKRRLLFWQWKDVAPASTCGFYTLTLHTWVNDLLWRGYQGKVTLDNLPHLEENIAAASRPTALTAKWARADQSKKNALLWVCMFHFKWLILASVTPRLLFISFRFAEPYLLEVILDFVAEPEDVNSSRTALLLTATYAFVHLGIAMAWAFTVYLSVYMRTSFRGSLITVVYSKLLRLKMSDTETGSAITLITADIERIERNVNMFHRSYTSVIEFIVSLCLLFRLIGWTMVAPILYSAALMGVGIPLAVIAGRANGPWLEAIEERMGLTSKVLGSMKSIRMSGYTNTIAASIRSLRSSDIRAGNKHRLYLCLDICIYYLTQLMPFFGLGVYAIHAHATGSRPLTSSTAFAALAIFQLMESPLMKITSLFEIWETLSTSFGRMQDFLATLEREDTRLALPSTNPTALTTTTDSAAPAALKLSGVGAGYSDEKPVLRDIDLTVASAGITMIVGPVGSGKSTLLRVMLGEMANTSGTVQVAHRISAYCPQTPWVTWGTIRSNILGVNMLDTAWYNSVIAACCLTPDLAALPDGDLMATGTRGSRLSGGQRMRISLARALYSKSPLIVLDDVLTGLDRETEKSILDQVFGPGGLVRQMNSTVVLATNSAKHLHFADSIVVLGSDGTIADNGAAKDILASNDYVKRLAGEMTSASSDDESLTDALEQFGINDSDLRQLEGRRYVADAAVYWYYIRTIGRRLFTVYILLLALAITGYMIPPLWVQLWTAADETSPGANLGYWLGVYLAIILGCILTSSASDLLLGTIMVPIASMRLHESLLMTTVKAKLSFLTSTAAGEIATRFSQDLDMIDDELPEACQSAAVEIFATIISVIMVCSGSVYLALTLPFFGGILIVLQRYYVRTSRELRLLDLESKAPMFSHILETGLGITSIRAYGWSTDFLERSCDLLDISQRPFYFLHSIQGWLDMALEFVVSGMAVILVALVTNYRGTASAFLGLALFNVVRFSTTLQDLIQAWTDLETAIGAIARMKTYVEGTEPEDETGRVATPPEQWPSQGAIQFNAVSATYDKDLEPALKQITLEIEAGQKVAICGRTGSGKSSLIAVLLSMLEVIEGSVTIDDLDISTLPLETIRERLNTISQDAFFLDGNVRENADPLGIASDDTIIDALKAVKLWDTLETRGGLDAEVSEKLLSQGEQQLFCLARAVIKPSRLVIMDEATSSVDADTDAIMQEVMRTHFADRTVISIAHKLHTVLDYDRIIMLDQGSIVESGPPRELLQTEGSRFKAAFETME